MKKKKLKTICVIPAKNSSSRLKGKNLLKIKDLSLVEITIKLAKKSRLFSNIILSSDSDKILNLAKKYNINSIKRLNKYTSTKFATTESVIDDLLKQFNVEFDNFIIMQVTSPLRKIDTLIKFYNYCIKNKIKKCLTVTEIHDNICFKSKYFKLNQTARRSQDRKTHIQENGLLYFCEKKSYLKTRTIYTKKKWNYFITDKYESIDINNLNDYKMAKKIF